MHKLLFLFIFSFIFLAPLISAEEQTLGAFKTDSCVTLKQTCGNCTFVNLSISIPPNQTTFLTNQPMTNSAPSLYTYVFCNTSINGEYIYDTYSNPNGILTASPVNFIINPLGKILTNSQAILYFLIFIISFILFMICIIFGIYVPSGNKRDEMTGYILAVNNMKYVKIFMFAISYLLLTLMTYFGWMVSFGYLDMDFLGTLFNFSFYFLIILMLPLFIVGVFVLIANAVRDSKVGEALTRGLRFR